MIPFYLAWMASAVLMIDRKIGKNACVILCGCMGFLEYNARIMYGVEEYQAYFDRFHSLFDKSWTMGEQLAFLRSSLSLMLMVLIFVLDSTLDAANLEEDACKLLNSTLAKQERILKMCVACRVEVKKQPMGPERDVKIKDRITEI